MEEHRPEAGEAVAEAEGPDGSLRDQPGVASARVADIRPPMRLGRHALKSLD